MSQWLLNCRLRAISAATTFAALSTRTPQSFHPNPALGLKFSWKLYHDILPSRTKFYAPTHNGQVRSLSQDTKPPCRSSKATFAELFAGIGGFHYALSGNGLSCVYANENNRSTAQTYERNHCGNKAGDGNEGLSNVDKRDIRDVVSGDMRDIPDHTVLVGGFPCQSFSRSGNQGGFACPKNGHHLRRVGKIVAAKRPAVALLENVTTFAAPRFQGLEEARRMFAELGYWFSHRAYCAADFNVPQNRHRLLMVAVRRDVAGEPFEMPDPPGRRAGLCLQECLLTREELLLPENLACREPMKYIMTEEQVRVPVRTSSKKVRLVWPGKHGAEDPLPDPTSNWLIPVGDWRTPNYIYKSDIILHPQGLARCLLTSTPSWYLVPDVDGVLTVRELYPREMARIQGFPDSFILPKFKSTAQQQFGNAVPPPMVDHIVKALIEYCPDIF